MRRAWNSSPSDAIIRSRLVQHVVLLEVTRTPISLREALLSSPELPEAHSELERRSLLLELDSGAKIIVKHFQYFAKLRAVRSLDLKPRRVIVSAELVEIVRGVIEHTQHT